MNIVLIGKRLAHHSVVAGGKSGKNFVTIFTREETSAGGVPGTAGFGARQSSGQSLIGDWVTTKAINRSNAFKAFDPVGNVSFHCWVTVGAGRSYGPQVEIGFELIIHPQPDRFTEAAHHDADAGSHGDSGGESCS